MLFVVVLGLRMLLFLVGSAIFRLSMLRTLSFLKELCTFGIMLFLDVID